MSAPATTRVDPITASVIAGALESIAVEMGHKLARMSYSSIIRESEDFGCVICDGAGAAARRVVAVHAAPVRADSRLHPRHQPPLRRDRRGVEAGRRRHPQPRLLRRVARARRRLRRPHLPRRRARRLLGDGRAPPRSGRTDTGLVRNRRRDRRVRRGAPVQRDQDRGGGSAQRVDLALHPRQRACRAARRRRHGGAGRRLPDRRGALRGADRPVRHRDRQGRERGPDGLLRATAAARDREAPGRQLRGRGLHRRLPGRPEPGEPRPADQGDGDRRRAPTSTSTWTAPRRRSTYR